ncbi:MAG: ABC transporter substrate-binding protein [Solirubrobacteraceae bacterium]|nr:ABC transporter substrate-binding protein [Solirubrobacteraceae bacterium]
MIHFKLPSAALAAFAAAAGLSACGGDDVVERPAHRPISVIYVAGDPEGPWKARTEGLADGVKLAIAERNGLMGERAVSTVVVPIEQRDGTTVSAGIGGGRILRDSRAIAVLGTYSAPQLALAAPQLNGGELSLLQYGSGMRGLTEPEEPGEPERFEPSGVRYALRAVPSDVAVGTRVKGVASLDGAQIVPVTSTYDDSLDAAAGQRAKEAQARREEAQEDGDDPLPSTDPALTNPSAEVPDAQRLAGTIAAEGTGEVVSAQDAASTKPTVIVVDPTEPDPSAAVLATLREVSLRPSVPLLVIDGADRNIAASAVGSGRTGPTFQIRRTIANAATGQARSLRARERKTFGRDRGDAVVAGYVAAQRILDLGERQPERTIDRVTFAKALTGPAPQDPNLPANAAGDATLGKVELYRLGGGAWVKR